MWLYILIHSVELFFGCLTMWVVEREDKIHLVSSEHTFHLSKFLKKQGWSTTLYCSCRRHVIPAISLVALLVVERWCTTQHGKRGRERDDNGMASAPGWRAACMQESQDKLQCLGSSNIRCRPWFPTQGRGKAWAQRGRTPTGLQSSGSWHRPLAVEVAKVEAFL